MKKQLFALAILAITGFSVPVSAQVHVDVNIGVQPIWGPVGYDHADYYYFPDIGVYYSVPLAQYTYFEGGRWINAPVLPPMYRNFDLYHSYKAVINEPNPWMHNDRYQRQYAQYRGRHDQPIIRESHDPRYFANPNHPQHSHYVGRPEERHGERHDDRRDEHGR